MTAPVGRAVNVPLLRKTLEHIEAHPEEWDQETWRCDSGMCFAGWAATLAGAEWAYEAHDGAIRKTDLTGSFWSEADASFLVIDDDASVVPVRHVAQRALGLSDRQADGLFSGANDLNDIREIVTDLCGGEL